jgi:hypothetical protein
MPVRQIRNIIVFCLLVSGCSMYKNAARNLFEAPIDVVDECTFIYGNRKIAQSVWRDFCRANVDATYSPDYAAGFIDGYADYLDAGGRPLEPAVPPWRYRRPKYQTPDGYRAIENWYAGFRDGTAAAISAVPGDLLRLPSLGAMLKSPDVGPRPPRSEPIEMPPDRPEKLPYPRPEQPESTEKIKAPPEFWETDSGEIVGEITTTPEDSGPPDPANEKAPG